MKSGAFEGLDLVMMAHPAPSSVVRPVFSAVKELHVIYHSTGGSSLDCSHRGEAGTSISSSPSLSSSSVSSNPLDAAVLAYGAVGMLRQQMKPTWRCHMIIVTSEKAAVPDVTPSKAVLECYIKAPDADDLCALESRARACFESASHSTGCRLQIKEMNSVHCDILHNPVLAGTFARNYGNLGADFADEAEMYGSTDMLRISRLVPTLYPLFAVGSGREVNHSAEFVGVANAPASHASALQAGKAMAHTVIDVLTTEGLMERVRESFLAQTHS